MARQRQIYSYLAAINIVSKALVGRVASKGIRVYVVALDLVWTPLCSTTLLVATHPNLKMFIYMSVNENTTEKLVRLVQVASLEPEGAVPGHSLF